MSKHKISIIFLAVINLMNIAAGIITQVKMITGSDVVSVIPIGIDMTVNQILIVNFMAATLIMMLVSVVTTYLVTDVTYSPKEIISNCAFVFMIVPILIFCAAVYNTIKAPIMLDKISVIISAVVYILFNVINFGCVLTIKEDEEL